MARLTRVLLVLVVLLGVPIFALRLLPSAASLQDPVPDDSHAFLMLHGRGNLPAVDTRRIQDLVSRMTVKEKVGQMTQLELGMITDGEGADLRMSPDKLRKAIVEYGVGSILNVKDQALPVQTWHEIISGIQTAVKQTRLGIPVIYGIDSIHGANYIQGGVLFPQPLGMAATWNPRLMLESSRITAAETRAAGIPWNFSPVLDVGRQPLWPRLYETFGEDVYLATVMGVASIRGYQGDDPSKEDRVAATMKHYVGYSLPTTGHDRTPALIPEITLREYFLPPFAAAVRAGAMSVMVNSGEVNGIPGHVDTFLLEDVLRGELGFKGVAVSDWEDMKKLVTIHRVAGTEKDATRRAILAGIDMSMVPSDYSFSDLLVELVGEGAVPISRIDEAVTRILTMKAGLGLLDDPVRGIRAAATVGSARSRRVALEAARESIVLLKNDKDVLPLSSTARVLVTGPTADSQPALNNGWTWTWQGDRAELYPRDRPTVRQALESALGNRITYVPGVAYDKEIDIRAAVAAAGNADVAVICLGELSYAETPGNIDDLTLPDAQLRLAQAVAATGKPVILVLIEGRPRIINAIVETAQAIVLALNPGLEGGTAISDVLRGGVNPGGKLPITYPRAPNALRTYDHKSFEAQDAGFGLKAYQPQFEFGFGLSYTTFAYSALEAGPKDAAVDVPIDVTVMVRNTGRWAGAEVVQLYQSQLVASITPPGRRLKRFVKVSLEPGESRQVRFQLTKDDLAFIGPDGKPLVEPGTYRLAVADLTQEVTRR